MTKERPAERSSVAMTRKVLVDAHVHLYPMFDRTRFLEAAVDHARAAGAALPWLLLTETAKDFAFRALADGAPAGWSSVLLGDGRTLELTDGRGRAALITAGRQVQTAEGLELLTLGLDDPIADGTALAPALARALEAGALAVVPWGFGKWSGRRGRILSEFLASPDGQRLYLGDNGGRPRFWPEPEPFRMVTAAGRTVLPGSDPLPFRSHEGRAGSYGLVLDVAIDRSRPFAALVDDIASGPGRAAPAGERAGAFSFLRDQVAIQIVKRGRR